MTEMPPLALLAGGLATRLGELTKKVPKAMLEVAGEPFIGHQLRLLHRERVPRAGACLFVLNHPNALVDPAFLLCFAPRRVSFLAKSPLFRTPVIGFLIRQLDSIPVYRKQDESGDTWLSYNDPSWLAERHGLGHEVDAAVGAMTAALDAVARTATAPA